MGLIISLELENGISIENAYARINTVGGSKEKSTISVHFYKDKISYNEGKELLKEVIFEFTPSVEDNSDNWIKQGYEYLKTSPLFVSSIDDI